ncbi:hypothetical protein MKJ01_01500 [Chryseobacterium sp. SSA4.19]|uniref:hypothetical protein n=1 Tax=Chryseobacterium sp. SSA4.19 TaxID=2919915 RepID=UPI001F4E94C3|nr:hypothetical protein [Chryseobacterium sp. SSA4.19]MCJ8152434.1 hypothetical protein [Chryseobacterium sp. SSA4.19]
MKNLLFLLIMSMAIFSCGTSHKATLEELKSTRSNYQMSYDAMRRGTVLSLDENGKIESILSEVQPDAAIATTTEITSKLAGNLSQHKNISIDQMTKIAETLSKLGERTAQVNMLRDALYRLEEHCINFKNECKGEVYWNSFNNVVQAITAIQKGVVETAEKEVEKASVELKKIQEFKTLPPEEKAMYYNVK